MKQKIIATTSTDSYQQSNQLFDSLIEPLSSPGFIGGLGLFILLLILSTFTQKKPELGDGRFANPSEIRKARRKGLRQIAKGKPNKVATHLDEIVLPDLQPAIAIVGRSRAGKTRSMIDPGIKSGIDQGWTMAVFDVKGNLMKKHLPYAHRKGYDCYVFAPGFDYSDGLNILDFMESEADAKKGHEIANVLNLNFQEPGSKPDSFFSPQGVALLKTVFMLAKECPFPDLLSAWKILSLDNLAGRLAVAHQVKAFGKELSSWIGEAAVALRSVSKADETAVGIVGTAVTHFQTLVDRSIIPCLLKSSIPLDLKGKQIVFFQIDEQSEAATCPLVATAIHMLIKRNLNAFVEREETFGLFVDEFTSIRLPDIESWINRFAEYGFSAWLGYQSDSQLRLRYSREYAESILSSCGTKAVFNTGHPETAAKFSSALGTKDVWYQNESRSYGKNGGRSVTDHNQKIPLLTGPAINRFEQGECVILNPGFDYRPYRLKVPIKKQNDELWSKCSQQWDSQIKSILTQQAQLRLDLPQPLQSDTPQENLNNFLAVQLSDRQLLAEAMLPTAEDLQALAEYQNNIN